MTVNNTVLAHIRQSRVLPVIVIDDAQRAVPLVDALCSGGLPCIEVTLRTQGALDALRRMTAERAHAFVGAGTVLTRQQARDATDAGATFIVSPGFHRDVVDFCMERDVPVFPGVCTPTEIGEAIACGLRILKFFPAEPMGGIAFLNAIAAPFGDVEFIPTGGINAANLTAWLGVKSVVACGGSWMAPRDWIDAGDFDRIRAEAARAAELAGARTGAVSA